jgi:hypothetical protein
MQKYRAAAIEWRARIQPLPYTTFGAGSRYTKNWLKGVERAAMRNWQFFLLLIGNYQLRRENISFSIAREIADDGCNNRSQR